MASNTRKATRGASAARKRSAQRQAPPRPRGGKKFDEELQVVLDHKQRIDAEYAQLTQQQQQLGARLEELKLLAHQVLGREEQLRELRNERPPLPPVALMAQGPQDGAEPAAEGEPEPKAD